MKKLLRSSKGVSPLQGTLVLMAIFCFVAFIGAFVLQQFYGNQSQPIVNFENVGFYSNGSEQFVEILIKNSGIFDVKIESVYLADQFSFLAPQNNIITLRTHKSLSRVPLFG